MLDGGQMNVLEGIAANSRACAPTRPAVIRATQAHHLLGIGRTRFWQLAKGPGFPRPVQIGARAKGYLIREIEEWAADVLPRG